jgi:phenylpropionate dioxygenase-like ring-hydroxylating dioxygenase large terminal subunit
MNERSKRSYPDNCWWVAATRNEITRKPTSRWLLDRRVVLYRTQSHGIVALEDRCAHRQAPLSGGRLMGDEIACPYHGFRYDAHGACTHIPTQDYVPTALRVTSYPVREHGPFVWIWIGDIAVADPTLLPDIPLTDDPAYLLLRGYTEVNCSYIAVQENLMDDAHFNYLHCPPYIDWAQRPALWSLPVEVRVTDRTVTTVMKLTDVPLAPIEAAAMGLGSKRRVNRTGMCTAAPPGCYFAEWVFEAPGGENGGCAAFSLRGVHGMTPISEDRSHWWWAYLQNYGHRAPRAFQAGWEAILGQDKDILEAVHLQRHVGRYEGAEVLVGADRALGELRQILRKMLNGGIESS